MRFWVERIDNIEAKIENAGYHSERFQASHWGINVSSL